MQQQLQTNTFGPPIPYHAEDGEVEYRDEFFEYSSGKLRVNPDVDLSKSARLVIKSVRLFKKRVRMSKKENAKLIREVRDEFASTKPGLHKSRKKGLLYGLLNIGVELSRQSHETEKDEALRAFQDTKQTYDQILFGCDHVIHQIEVQVAETA